MIQTIDFKISLGHKWKSNFIMNRKISSLQKFDLTFFILNYSIWKILKAITKLKVIAVYWLFLNITTL